MLHLALMPDNKKEYSFGCVVVYRGPNGDQFLLVGQEDFWGFPKGHAEENETQIETAQRELAEECSVSNSTIIPEYVFRDAYTITYNGELIEKSIVFFLAIAGGTQCRPQEGEIKDCGYFPYVEARECLTYDGSKRILDEAKVILEKIPKK